MAPVVIQKAFREDAKDIQHFFRLEEEHHARMYPDYFVPQAADVPLSEVEEDIQDPDSVLVVAKDGGRSVAFLHGKLRVFSREPQFREVPYLMIEDCFVDPEYRKQGIATRLLMEAKAWALERGIHRLQLQVWERNQDAARLYEGMGFENLVLRMELKL